MRRFSTLIFAFCLVCTNFGWTKDYSHCVDVFRNNVRDYLEQNSGSENYQSAKNSLQTSNVETLNDNEVIDIHGKISVAGGAHKGSINVNMMRNQLRVFKQSLFQTSESELSASQFQSYASSFVSTEALKLFNDCIRATDQGFAITPTVDPDSSLVSINISFTTIGASSSLDGVSSTPLGCMTCSTRCDTCSTGQMLVGSFTRLRVGNEGLVVVCRRNSSVDTVNGVRFASADKASLQISGGGLSYQLTLPKRDPVAKLRRSIEALNKDMEVPMPVGSIVASLVAPNEGGYLASNSNWIVARGQKAPGDSKYAEQIGDSLPDLQGVFLRGIDSNGNRDPSKNRTPGSLQTESIKSHEHAIISDSTFDFAYIDNSGSQSGFYLATGDNTGKHFNNDDDFGTSSKPDEHFGSETRPINVAVYYYVKID